MKNSYVKYLFVVFLLMYTTAVLAERVEINGIPYDVIVKAKQAKVLNSSLEYTGHIVIPATIVHNGVTCNVTSIEYSAFEFRNAITGIEIPNTVTSIGYCAFNGCSSLTSITIPNSVTSIEESVFNNCSNLEEIIVEKGNPVYDSRDNCNAIIETATNSLIVGCKNTIIPKDIMAIAPQAFQDCKNLKSVVIPDSVISIGQQAFYYCKGLTSIVIPNSVTNIGGWAFYDCSSLTNIEIPNSVTSIESNTFYSCSSLTSVTIGAGVEEISLSAFAKCENLTDVYCLATTPPVCERNSDGIIDTFIESFPEYMTLYVPANAINEYKKTAPWNTFGNIVAINGGSAPTPTPKCANPVISYRNGELLFNCRTDSAEFVTKITDSDIDTFYSKSVTLSATYNISVYATANGYDNSDVVNATLCWIECDCGRNNNGINSIGISSTAALVTSNNGVITVDCSLDGKTVAVYTSAGVLIDEVTIKNGNAIVQTSLSKGSVAIVKIGEKSVKVVVD